MSPAALVDVVLALTGLELAALIVWRARGAGGGRRAVSAFVALLPGICLILAVRAALHEDGWQAVAWITASLPAHLFDLARSRWLA